MPDIMKATFTLLLLILIAGCSSTPTLAPSAINCTSCAEWNVPHAPVRIHGNTYYVGTNALSAILVTSPSGHALIDGALPQSAPQIIANVEALGFRMKDVKLILNSHAHFDHAGGIAELQRVSGATIAASPRSEAVLETGRPAVDDSQYRDLLPFPFPPVREVRLISDGETLSSGTLALTAHFTPGHSTGGTTWSWKSCEDGRCLDVVYADSLTAVAEEGFRFSRNDRYPTALQDFAGSFEVIERLKCDILLTPHPAASAFWDRVAARKRGNADALINPGGCRTFVEASRKRLAERVQSEQ